MLRHVLNSDQFSRTFLENQLFPRALDCKKHILDKELRAILRRRQQDKMVLGLFAEPSTRTKLSFSTAGLRLGAGVVIRDGMEFFDKFPSIEDAIRFANAEGQDLIVMRHPETGSVARAASVSSVPVINGGDGTGEHPTQTLLDLFTIHNELGRVDDLTIVMGGDLRHGRTVRSLARLLCKFRNIRLILVSAPSLKIEQDVKDYLKTHGVRFWETANIKWALGRADVVYWTRTQKERIADEAVRNAGSPFSIGPEEMSWMKRHAILMHPMPRINEISYACDSDPRAAYFRQAENGLYVRAALLDWVLE